ncbi:MAG TPA: glucose 1-dehydrogenase [Pyrinomonadaceae bacterium]|nr:glucose 1-dehydrogenase [Pyrinomonadaceae bacterium]
MDVELKGKSALVTGASSGIGRATALRFAASGARVALVGRDVAALEAVANEIARQGGEALVVAANVTNEEDAERAVKETVERFGSLDVLVNAAGVLANGTLEETTLNAWDAMMNVNVRAVFHLMQLAIPHLEKVGGNIVNVSSVTGLRAFPGVLAYCVSKAGVDQLTRCAALELAAKGIRVNAVNPGVVRTQVHRRGGMSEEAYAAFLEHSRGTHPLGRVGEAEEVAELILFLASERAAWITGATYSIDGGRAQTCAR